MYELVLTIAPPFARKGRKALVDLTTPITFVSIT